MKAKANITFRGTRRSIFIRISFGAYEEVQPDEVYKNGKKYRRIEFYTGETINPKDWDVAKGKSKSKDDSYLNGQIEKALLRIKEIYGKLSYDEEVEYNKLKQLITTDEQLHAIFNKKERVVEVQTEYKAPMDFIQDLIDKSTVTVGTKKDYNNSLTHLKEFDAYRGKTATWKSMGYEYYLDLVGYLKSEKRLKASTIDKVVKNLKVFLNYADLEDKIEVNQDFKKTISGKSLFAKVNKDETDHVYLNESEIKQITNAVMTDERQGEIRDLFIIGCWTGLRISDLSRLEKGNIKNGLLSITTQKTHQKVVIPITDELQTVLNKYNELPKIPTDQHYNREIKKICEIAGINELVMAETKVNGITVIKEVPKYELISSHASRRSFATNLYRRGIPSTQLMMLTGHKTEDAFMRYIKVSKEDNAKDVAKKLKKLG
ncbi:MAG: tyrosine-type recombinase/integrase [Dysgonamonadaceae bacterium]|nr:tyrosine-type recombinase/integrase [Dysgonamonadaceae bacterium]